MRVLRVEKGMIAAVKYGLVGDETVDERLKRHYNCDGFLHCNDYRYYYQEREQHIRGDRTTLVTPAGQPLKGVVIVTRTDGMGWNSPVDVMTATNAFRLVPAGIDL